MTYLPALPGSGRKLFSTPQSLLGTMGRSGPDVADDTLFDLAAVPVRFHQVEVCPVPVLFESHKCHITPLCGHYATSGIIASFCGHYKYRVAFCLGRTPQLAIVRGHYGANYD